MRNHSLLKKIKIIFTPIFDHCELALLAGMMENQFVIGLTITMLRGSAKRDAVVVSIPRLHNLGNRAHQKEIMECRFKPIPCIEHTDIASFIFI